MKCDEKGKAGLDHDGLATGFHTGQFRARIEGHEGELVSSILNFELRYDSSPGAGESGSPTTQGQGGF